MKIKSLNADLTAEFNCGFSISTGSADELESNFEEKYQATPDPEAWETINSDLRIIERSCLESLKKVFKNVSDEGHDNQDDLIGTVWMDKNNMRQMDLLKKHYYKDPADAGLWNDPEIYNNSMIYYPEIYDIRVTFFAVPEEIITEFDLE